MEKLKKYRCKRGFVVDCYDADGFLIEGESVVIDEGKAYSLDNSGVSIIGGTIHLDAEDDLSWLEITPETLSEYFEEVCEE